MAQPYEERNSAAKTRRQQEDQRRMEFRRAIEDRFELRQLKAEIGAQRGRLASRKLHRRALKASRPGRHAELPVNGPGAPR